jgi:hypothetical protein
MQAMAVRGTLGASLIDYTTGLTIRSVGRLANGSDELTGLGAANVVRAVVHSAAFASIGQPSLVEDVVITSSNGCHVIQFVSTGFDARLVLYLWLDPVRGNLALTKRGIRRLARELVASENSGV